MMELIKLDNRHKLFKSGGYHIAFKFNNWVDNRDTIYKMEKWLHDVYGVPYDYYKRCDNFNYAIYWAKARTRSSSRVYWIALRHEEDALLLTMAM
jgi:hypothetical protein